MKLVPSNSGNCRAQGIPVRQCRYIRSGGGGMLDCSIHWGGGLGGSHVVGLSTEVGGVRIRFESDRLVLERFGSGCTVAAAAL